MAVQIFNETTLALAFMAGRVTQPSHQLTAMVKGTFALGADGEPKPLAQPLFAGDEHWNDERDASCAYPSDFAPFKPRADLMVVGTCHPPGNEAVTSAKVTFGLDRVNKTLAVFGDRHFVERRLGKPQPSEPTQFHTMPLRYENAFGGDGFEANPVGKGFAAKPTRVPGGITLPNIELPDTLIRIPTDRVAPAGFGPLDRNWMQRTSKMGSYDDGWLANRWPDFPEDFDWAYFNAAPADQQLPYLRGDESWFIEGMHPEQARYESHLPALRPRCFIHRNDNDRIEEIALNLDTVFIDMDARTLVVVWRGLASVATRRYDEIDRALLTVEALGDAAQPSEHYHAESWWQALEPKEEALAPDATMGSGPGVDTDEEAAADSTEADTADKQEVEAMRQELIEAKADAGLLERLKGVTRIAVFTQILTAHLKDVADAAGQSHDEDEQAEESLESMRAELAEAGVDPALLERLATATSKSGFVAILVDGLPPPENTKGAEQRKALIESLNEAGEQEQAHELAAQAMPRAVRGERLTRDEVIALVQAGESLAGANLTELNLSELDLSGVDLSDAKLESATLTGTKLDAADLTGASLHLARLKGATLTDCVAAGADFRHASAEGVDLSNSNLAGCDFTSASLEGAVLINTDLATANLTAANLEGATLNDANLERARLDGSVLRKAQGQGASFREATLIDADLTEATLDHAVLINCALDRAKLIRVSLRDAFLEGASGVGVDFEEADARQLRARGVRLAEANLRSVRADGASWMNADLTSANFSAAVLMDGDLSSATLAGADFSGARMERANLSHACLVGAKLTQVNLFEGRLSGADLTDADCRSSNFFGCDLFEAVATRTRFARSLLGRTCLAKRAQ